MTLQVSTEGSQAGVSTLQVQAGTLATTNEVPDRILLQGVRHGDERAFEALFARHYSGVFGVVVRIVGTHEEAEEVTQDTFLKLYHRPLADDDETNVRGWLYRVATNAAFNSVRSRRRRLGWLRRFAGRVDRHADDDPLDLVARRDEAEIVREQLAGLPERQRMVLVLRSSGMSYAEVANAISVNPNSVGTILARAERAFRASYESVNGRNGGSK
ncbi:MAG: sigma-70 family RNA polymerase sigma factor [Chloroflexota bacterium]|nr:sigma-70 family RNA polymerase sigma factor [Chloroflexota bacterium]